VSDVDDQPFGPTVARFDDAVDHSLDRLRGNPVTDRVFYALTEAANFSLLWYAVAAVRAIVSPRYRRDVVRLAVCIGIESVIVNQGLKRFFRRSRPDRTNHVDPHDLRQPSTSSFPSGHASSALFAAGLLTDTDRRHRGLYYGLAALVAASRPYVRIHHASDVLGGAVVGWMLGRIARRIWPL
jgi:membrane-associated phospholipid phosphatase